jgi:hypothetical protein
MDHCVDILEGRQLAQQLLPGNPVEQISFL